MVHFLKSDFRKCTDEVCGFNYTFKITVFVNKKIYNTYSISQLFGK
jgi:hypothetical protein